MDEPFISILLPTRNRLNLLREAISTVLRQDDGDFEIIIADNDSTDDISSFVQSLNDNRIRYFRSERFLSVTENWNRAVNVATGSYVIMLGDDDGLTPGYISKIRYIVEKLDKPDFIYHGAYHFAHPDVFKDYPDGYVMDVCELFDIFKGSNFNARPLDVNVARAAGQAGLEMRAIYGFNMQYFTFHRKFLDKLRRYGPIFQGPFPDFYTANLAMLTADSPAVFGQPLTIIGISKKSYGYLHFNGREKEGIELLANKNFELAVTKNISKLLLPGSLMDAQWLISVSLVQEALKGQMNLSLGISRYRQLQIFKAIIQNFTLGKRIKFEIRELVPYLSFLELIGSFIFVSFLNIFRFMKKNKRNNIEKYFNDFFYQYGESPNRSAKNLSITANSVVDIFEILSLEK